MPAHYEISFFSPPPSVLNKIIVYWGWREQDIIRIFIITLLLETIWKSHISHIEHTVLGLALTSSLSTKARFSAHPEVTQGKGEKHFGVNNCSWCWLLYSQGGFRDVAFVSVKHFPCLLSCASLMYSSARRLFQFMPVPKRRVHSPHSSPPPCSAQGGLQGLEEASGACREMWVLCNLCLPCSVS